MKKTLFILFLFTACTPNYNDYTTEQNSIPLVAPEFSVLAGNYQETQSVQLTSKTSWAKIYYTTNGSEPNAENGTLYQSPILVNSSTVIKAIAIALGYQDSPVSSAFYTINNMVSKPFFSLLGGSYETAQTLSIQSLTAGSIIRYTLDGSNPSKEHGEVYTGPITIDKSLIVKAIAYRLDMNSSAIGYEVFTIGNQLQIPIFSMNSGAYPSDITVKIQSTAGAHIYYTTNGSNPSEENGTLYQSPINVHSSTVIKAIAISIGHQDSPISTAEYMIDNMAFKPFFSLLGGSYDTAQTLTLQSLTAGATIRYTLDSSEPTPQHGQIYTGPILINNSLIIKAIAYKADLNPSTVSYEVFTIGNQAQPPIFSVQSGTYTSEFSVSMQSNAGAKIYYTTNGSTPSSFNGTLYTQPVNIDKSLTLKAIAIKDNLLDSPVVSSIYQMQLPNPLLKRESGTYTSQFYLEIESMQEAEIYYTLDGSNPDKTHGTLYSNPILINSALSVKAKAFKTGWEPSEVVSKTYGFKTPTPSFSTPQGTYSSALFISLSAPSNATIYYTLDGSNPSKEQGEIYTNPIPINHSCSLKAVAYIEGWESSDIAFAQYSIVLPAANPPTFSLSAGTYTYGYGENPPQLTLSSSTPNAQIYYTTNGNAPTPTTGILYTGPISLYKSYNIRAAALSNSNGLSSIVDVSYTIIYTVGKDWANATNNAEFSVRNRHTSVVFDNKMWVIGEVVKTMCGIGPMGKLDLATPNAGFSAREYHTSVVFDNKMWVIGGRLNINSSSKNDVWYSSDGIIWHQATNNAEFSVRNRHTSVVFDNKMWVIGGSSKNDVWYSTDGVNWTLATNSAGFSGRSGHTNVVFDNKMWVIGGSSGGSYKNDVWYSSDGIIWNQATSNAGFSSRSYHTSVVFDNKMWVIGGISGSALKDVWSSFDGINWTQATDNAEFSARYGHTNVVFDNKMWVIGGSSKNDVWYSEQ